MKWKILYTGLRRLGVDERSAFLFAEAVTRLPGTMDFENCSAILKMGTGRVALGL